jgi:DNA replication protein DnaC
MSTLQQLINNFQRHDYVLVSGKAGTGKSYLLQLFKQYLIKFNLNFALTAPTAVAAVNVCDTFVIT